MSELYTRLFVDSQAPQHHLLKVLAAATNGSIDGYGVNAPPFGLDVRPSEYLKDLQRVPSDTDFFAFAYNVEIWTESDAPDENQYIAFVGVVMRALHAAGMTVVAACDWEDQLPGNGRLNASEL